jgi:DNA-binding response OmpR family regulator
MFDEFSVNKRLLPFDAMRIQGNIHAELLRMHQDYSVSGPPMLPSTPETSQYTIFIVDEVAESRPMGRVLRREKFRVLEFLGGESAIRKALSSAPSLFILEVTLAQGNGLLICDRIRRTPALCLIPIIFVSRRRNEADKVAGLEAGADDYLGKPFGERELVARVRAILRRCYELAQPALLQFGDVELDSNTVTLTVKGEPADITLSEFRLLEYFVRNPSRTFSRDHLLKMIRSNLDDVKPRLVDVYVKKIRRKIEVHEEHPQYLRTVRGLGYCFHLPDMPRTLLKS